MPARESSPPTEDDLFEGKARWQEFPDTPPSRWPCEKYIQFLLVGTSSRWCLRDIQQHISHLGYPRPHLAYLLKLRDQLERSRPKPYLVGSRPPERWLRKRGFEPLYKPSHEATIACSLLAEHDARTAIEALLLSGVPQAQVEQYLEQLTGMEMPAGAITHYQTFYWNRRLLTPEEWGQFLKMYPDGDGLHKCYLLEPVYTLYYLGVHIQDLDMRSMLNDLAQGAYFRVLETKMEPSTSETARKYRLYGTCMIDVYRELSGATEMGRMVEQIRSIGLQRKKKEIDQITAGIKESRVLDGTTISVEEPEAQGVKK